MLVYNFSVIRNVYRLLKMIQIYALKILDNKSTRSHFYIFKNLDMSV